jgi:hypothetical protein
MSTIIKPLFAVIDRSIEYVYSLGPLAETTVVLGTSFAFESLQDCARSRIS